MQHLQESVERVEKQILQEQKKEEVKVLINEMKKIGIEDLPYAYTALKRFIDPETMNVHYNKHYKGYVNKLNDLLSKRKSKNNDLEKIIRNISKYPKAVRDNAGGAFNHALFWNMLSPKPMKVGNDIKQRIIKDFGSFDRFKKEFEKIATERFGSGWVWLIITKKNTLKVMSTPNQDNPLMNVIEDGGFPLLGLDLWEHAYYLKYKNKRDEYIKNFWTSVNWDFVEGLYKMRSETRLTEIKEVKGLILEGKSESCSKEEKDFYRVLFSVNENVVEIYKNTINKIIKRKFADKWFPYSKGELAGVYNLEKEGRSDINYLNTNYTVICPLIKDINKVITRSGQEPISFAVPPQNQVAEMKRLCNFIEKYQDRIFDPKSATFQNMMALLLRTNEQGSKREEFAKKVITEKIPNSKVVTTAGSGSVKDAVQKIDLEVFINGQKNTCQVKGFMELKPADGKIVIIGSGEVRYYNVDWMVFVNIKMRRVVIFRNTPNIVMGEYVFDESDLIYNLNL
jgi:Fe-Mn family superoxide dismutase